MAQRSSRPSTRSTASKPRPRPPAPRRSPPAVIRRQSLPGGRGKPTPAPRKAPAPPPRRSGSPHRGGPAPGSGATTGGYQLDANQLAIANIILGEGHRLGATRPALIASMYAAKGETDFGANSRTYVNNGVGYWGVLQGDMRDWPDPHDVKGQALAFFTGRGPQGQTDFHVGAINWVRQGVTYPPEIAVRTEVPSIWPVDAYSPGGAAEQAQNLAAATSVVDQVAGGGPVPTPRGQPPPPVGNVPNIIISGNIEDM